MSKVKVVLYSEEYGSQLEKLLKEFSEEVFGYGTANLETFVNSHWMIYLALRGDEVIGFSSYTYNTYCGLRPPTVGQTYLYVQPAYRKGRASYLLSVQAGFVSVDTNLPLEHYYASEASASFGHNRLTGTKIYEAYLYPVEELKREYTKVTRLFKERP